MRASLHHLILAGALAAPAFSFACQPPGVARSVAVAAVHDGDTVRLRDGRRVRLIGVDAPELGREGQPAEPHAEAARQRLRTLLEGGAPLRLHLGSDARDRHGRTLGHLVLADGTNVQEQLLEAGVAIVLAVPPNIHLLDCYLAAEARARGRGVGVWRDGSFGPIAAERLPPDARGFRLVQGRVERLGVSRRSLWLEMGPRFSARVPREGLSEATLRFLQSLPGRRVTVRGFLFGDRQRLHLTVTDRSMIEVQD